VLPWEDEVADENGVPLWFVKLMDERFSARDKRLDELERWRDEEMRPWQLNVTRNNGIVATLATVLGALSGFLAAIFKGR
jgi:hypothetical protein